MFLKQGVKAHLFEFVDLIRISLFEVSDCFFFSLGMMQSVTCLLQLYLNLQGGQRKVLPKVFKITV